MTANIYIILHKMQAKLYFFANYFHNNLYQIDYQ